jgi:energy-coupling factor transporter ATP-binding protein EcfA2
MTLTFLHLSDLHFESKNSSNFELLKDKIISSIDNDDKEINFIIFSGDLIQKPLENEFEKAYSVFIKPIVDYLNLNNNSLILTNGNHDVALDKRDKYSFNGFINCLIGHDRKNVIKDLLDNKISFQEHQDYLNFTNGLNQNNIVNNNIYYSTLIKKISDIEIGFISLNTSLLMQGSDKDFGNLEIVEEILEQALREINTSTMKILNIHHPLNWFKNYKEIEKIILDRFNIVFYGHEHEHDGKYTVDAYNRDILNLHAQSLYHKSDLSDGFAIYKYNIHDEELLIKKYIYNKSQNNYDKSDIKKIENIDLLKKSKTIRNQNICTVIKNPLKEHINKFLAINLTSESLKEDIENIYIHQKITEDTNNNNNIEENKKNLDLNEKEYSIKELIETKDNLLFFGKKEIGKTTLLNILNIEYLNKYGEKIPIYLLGSELLNEKSEYIIFAKISDYLKKFYGEHKFKIPEMLKEKRFLLLIDNIQYLENDLVNKLLALNNQIIATYRIKDYDNIYAKLNHFNLKSENLNKFKQFNIHAFRQKDSNELTKRIVPIEYSKQISTSVKKTINKLSLPSNPFITTLLIWMYRDKIEIKDNEPEIIEVLLDYLLEKSDIKRNFDSRINFDNKKNILAAIAYKFFEQKSLSLDENIILETIITYVKTYFAFKISANDILKYFYDRRIFIFNTGQIQFTYRVFYYYFISLFMIKNNDFYHTIFENELLVSNMSDELKFYSALKNDDLSALNKIEDFIFKSLFNEKLKKININLPSNYAILSQNISEGVYEQKKSEIELEDLDIKISEDEKNFIDKIDSIKTNNREIEIEKFNNENEMINIFFQNKEEYFVLNMIYSEFIKNLSNVTIDIQNRYVNKAMTNISNITKYWFSKINDTSLTKRFISSKIRDNNDLIDSKKTEELRELVKSNLLAILTEIIETSLCTRTMVDIYIKNYNNTNDIFLKYYYLIFIIETDEEENFLNYIKSFIKLSKMNKTFLYILYGKLIHDYVNKNYLSKTKKEILNILIHLELNLNSVENDNIGRNKSIAKNKVEHDLKVKRMIG